MFKCASGCSLANCQRHLDVHSVDLVGKMKVLKILIGKPNQLLVSQVYCSLCTATFQFFIHRHSESREDWPRSFHPFLYGLFMLFKIQ